MTIYDDAAAKFAKVVQDILIIKVKQCSRQYTVSPCAATDQGNGARCFYSYPTCQDKANYNQETRSWKFCLNEALPPKLSGIYLPYIAETIYISQRIDPEHSFTINGRVKFKMIDDYEPAPFNLDKASGSLINTGRSGWFFRRFKEIYRNYADVEIEFKRGFVESGWTENDFRTQLKGKVKNFIVKGNEVIIETADILADIDKNFPAQISTTNLTAEDLDSSETVLDVDDASEVTDPADISSDVIIELDHEAFREPSSGENTADAGTSNTQIVDADVFDAAPEGRASWIGLQVIAGTGASGSAWVTSWDQANTKVGVGSGLSGMASGDGYYVQNVSEYCICTSRDTVNDQLTLQRGRYGSTGVPHGIDAPYREVVIFGTEAATPSDAYTKKNIMDIMLEILDRCEIPSANVDTTQFNSERDLYMTDIDFSRILTEPHDAEELLKELREIGNVSIWVEENNKITCKVFVPPASTTLVSLNDDDHFINSSIQVDDQDEKRLTRIFIYYDHITGTDGDKPEHFNRALARVDTDLETTNNYGQKKLRKIFSKWADESDDAIMAAQSGRILQRYGNGLRLLNFALELKDIDSVNIGDIVEVTTAHISDTHGADVDKRMFQVISKHDMGNYAKSEALDTNFTRRYCYIAPNGTPDYDSASEEEKRFGFIGRTGTNTVGAQHEDGYYAW